MFTSPFTLEICLAAKIGFGSYSSLLFQSSAVKEMWSTKKIDYTGLLLLYKLLPIINEINLHYSKEKSPS